MCHMEHVRASVFLVKHISGDGEANWLEGVTLLGAYLIIAIGFFFVPAKGRTKHSTTRAGSCCLFFPVFRLDCP